MKKDNLGDRMKENYENRAKTQLLRRTPVIIRLDGKAFHTFTRGFKKPFDDILTEAMQQTMLTLFQGCVLGYTQSDEITLVLTDYKKLETAAWFDYDIQKVCSVSASIATLAFNRGFLDAIRNSINSVGRANFSHKELQGLSTDQILKKLLEEKQTDWNKLPVHLQRGSCCIKREVNGVDSWFIDTEIPIFKGEDRDYIEKLI